MVSSELRKSFLDFFKKKGHTVVPSSSLIPADPSVLFTTAGMQQFKTYYLGEKFPYGLNAASCQKCFRTSDIEEIGDNTHLTFLEMLGNFSFAVSADLSTEARRAKVEASGEGGAGYFKEKTIELAFEFLTKRYCQGSPGKLQADKLWITVFKGGEGIPGDKESQEIWQRLGVPKKRIHGFGRADNFWGPTGEEGPCGPTTEIHYDLTGKPCEKKESCVPNCSCGRFIELWNLVFNEYFQDKNKKLATLRQKGVDTGMGLERLTMVCQKKTSVYETDLFEPIIKSIEKNSSKPYTLNPIPYRIIADHVKSSVFLISEGIFPSNVERGYVLRRILRRAIRYGKLLELPEKFLIPLAQKVIETYKDIYPEVKSREADILTVIQNEEEKFEKTLERGLKEFKRYFRKPVVYWEGEEDEKKISERAIKRQKIMPGFVAFRLFATYGFPIELIKEIAIEEGIEVDENGFRLEMLKHQEISRAGAEKKFGGIGKEADLKSARLHTATHLLHAALRQVLGEHVRQMGSDITSQRLRFDFSHPVKMSDEEIKKVADLVNQKIKENLEVKKEEMSYEKAVKSGALSFFKEKYPEAVFVYSINNFSKEICAGPHVNQTSELGKLKIIKEESSGAGIRRIRAILE